MIKINWNKSYHCKRVKCFILILLYIFNSSICQSQSVINLKEENGVYYIPCKINNIPMQFVFDSGASDVTISITEALFLLKNGNLKKTDILGKEYFTDAEGEISEGTKIIIRKIEVGKIVLFDVPATIVHNSDAPLLFGQTAIKRFGKYTIDYEKLTLTISSTPNSFQTSNKDDYYIICVKAVKLEEDAKVEVKKLTSAKFKADYLWIPNYPSLSGNKYYSVYIGPFNTQSECKTALIEVKKFNPESYGCLISKTGKKLRLN